MNPDHQHYSFIASPPRRRVRTVIRILVGVAATVLVTDVATAADAPSSPPRPTAASCVVDVSDWPLGILPDDASAAFGPGTLAACKEVWRNLAVLLNFGACGSGPPAATPVGSAPSSLAVMLLR